MNSTADILVVRKDHLSWNYWDSFSKKSKHIPYAKILSSKLWLKTKADLGLLSIWNITFYHGIPYPYSKVKNEKDWFTSHTMWALVAYSGQQHVKNQISIPSCLFLHNPYAILLFSGSLLYLYNHNIKKLFFPNTTTSFAEGQVKSSQLIISTVVK